MSGPGPYRQWPARGEHARWLRAANLFGQHLLQSAAPSERFPEDTTDQANVLARQAALDALHGVMAMLDGVPKMETEDGYRVEYVLQARILERRQAEWHSIETFELAPGGDGMCMGLAGWIKGDFGDATPELPPGARPALTTQQQQRERVHRKRESIERRAAGGPPCPYCGKPLRTAQAKQCFQCGKSWRED